MIWHWNTTIFKYILDDLRFLIHRYLMIWYWNTRMEGAPCPDLVTGLKTRVPCLGDRVKNKGATWRPLLVAGTPVFKPVLKPRHVILSYQD